MSEAPDPSPGLIDWGVAFAALPGEGMCGDVHVVKRLRTGAVIAVMDGLGHGAEAAEAAERARDCIESAPPEPLIALLERCHRVLRKTRGVVMSLVEIDVTEDRVHWTGVGNVEVRLLHTLPNGFRSSASPTLMGGVVGYQLPRPRETVAPIRAGDVLIFATDGIDSGFADDLSLSAPPQQIADGILESHGRDSDDALVLVARYLGTSSHE